MRVLLIGPCPPPDNGTTFPFRSFVEYVRQHCEVEAGIVNTSSGDKTGVPILSPRLWISFLRISCAVLFRIPFFDLFLINGSRRYIATIGALHTLLISLVPGKRAGIYIAGGAFHDYYHGLAAPQRVWVRFCLRRASAVVVQTNMAYNGLRGCLSNLQVVPNWIQVMPTTIPFGGHYSMPQSNETPAKPFRFVFTGDVVPEKGILELVAAFKIVARNLSKAGIAVHLDIYGPYRDRSWAIIEPCIRSGEPSITYHGYSDHATLMRSLQTCHAMVMPTKYATEGHPAALIEAMAMGLPVIATEIGGIPEFITNNVNGFLVHPGDVEALAEHMTMIAKDQPLRARISEKARETARRFDAAVLLPELCRIYGMDTIK